MDALAKPGSEARLTERTLALPRDEADRWRLELERAQMAHDPSSAQDAARARAAEHRPSMPSRVLPRPAAPIPAAPGERNVDLPLVSTLSRDSTTPTAADVRERSANSPPCASPPFYAQNEWTARAESTNSDSVPEASSSRSQYPVKHWPPVNAHACVDGDSAALWVRDASLTDSDRTALALRLQSAMRTIGFDVRALAINGEPVIMPPAAIAGRSPSR